jgi:YecR-like lipoprotein
MTMKNSLRSVLLFALALSTFGCATQKQWLVTRVSRSDATVDLSYERNEFQSVHMDMEEGHRLAASRCEAWGYKDAEALGSERNTCTSRRGFGNCGSRTVTVQFQCTGSPSKGD